MMERWFWTAEQELKTSRVSNWPVVYVVFDAMSQMYHGLSVSGSALTDSTIAPTRPRAVERWPAPKLTCAWMPTHVGGAVLL